MNKCIILGRLGEDPQLKALSTGTMVCRLNIATSEYIKKEEKVEWHNVVVWGKAAENCAKYLSKGSQVVLEGKLQTTSWLGKDDKKRYKTEIVASHVQFLDKKEETPF